MRWHATWAIPLRCLRSQRHGSRRRTEVRHWNGCWCPRGPRCCSTHVRCPGPLWRGLRAWEGSRRWLSRAWDSYMTLIAWIHAGNVYLVEQASWHKAQTRVGLSR